MIIKRIVGFTLTVMLMLGVIGATSPHILQKLKLGLDLKGGFEILYEAKPAAEGGVVTPEALRQTAAILQKRADAHGVAEPQVTPEGHNRIRAKIAGAADEKTVRDVMKKPAELVFRGPDGSKELIGSDFVEGGAEVGYDELNRPVIHMKVIDPSKLRGMAARLMNKPLSIYLDDRLLSTPIVQAVPSDGIATISGSYTLKEAHDLADAINLGALPLQLTEKYAQSVGATLGQQSLQQTVAAGLLASAFIVAFMAIVYRVPGIIAGLTLAAYTWGLLLAFYWMQATLTLPGIAAFVLGIGMAVDANIITNERIKDELRSGLSLPSACKAGTKQSLRTIVDANVTTAIAGAVLYYIGTGPIQGFALTLLMSIALSMATNVWLSRMLLQWLVSANAIRNPAYFGVKRARIESAGMNGKAHTRSDASDRAAGRFDFVKWRHAVFAVSAAIAIMGVVSLLAFHLKLGVDFQAGTSLDLDVGAHVEQADAERIIEEAGYHPDAVTVGGDGQERVNARFASVLDADRGDASRIVEAFRSVYGGQVSGEENSVDPGIARELGIKAVYAVSAASAGIAAYVAIRFDWRFALAAIVSLLHDAFIVVTVFSLFRLEVNLPFIAAILTIVGYSINDTIVVFDRIRSNMRFADMRTFASRVRLVNASIAQTFARSVNTALTVLFASVILYLFGSASIRLFALAMTLGVAFGCFSSIFIASQLWLVLKKNPSK